MNKRYLPTTRLGKLEWLIEECAEVIQAAQKVKRCVEYDNITALENEMKDLEHAVSSVRCCDLTKLEA